MSIQLVNTEILSGAFTNDQLASILDAVKFARAQLSKAITRSLKVGNNVKFTSTRDGVTYSGIVVKINTKYILVNTPHGPFNVPSNMLEVV